MWITLYVTQSIESIQEVFTVWKLYYQTVKYGACKEVVLSSMIKGTQSTPIEPLLFELEGKPGISAAVDNKCLTHLENIGSVHEMTGAKRNRLFCYKIYVEILNQGKELPV